MIQTETKNGGVQVGMKGAVGELMIEIAFVLKKLIQSVPEDKRVDCLSEICANALIFAKDEEEGSVSPEVRVENADVLMDAINKIIGGIESNE